MYTPLPLTPDEDNLIIHEHRHRPGDTPVLCMMRCTRCEYAYFQHLACVPDNPLYHVCKDNAGESMIRYRRLQT